LLVEAGLTPWQALAAATTDAGAFLGRSWGLAVGDEGSVVLLEASPIADIRNTERIHAVVHHGVVIDREALLDR
ncbi:MAG: amidohydrolase, partial [Thermoanaerobaculia bacterium]|nr:amidohydrolase [Thermoanaerobaculia bacterium]